MPPSTRIVTLDLGSQSIGLAEFSIRANGPVVLENYRRREILAEPAGEGMRHAQMAVLLREMIEELRNKRGNVNYSVTGQSVFVRFVKLPAVDKEKIERIISFEAQQDVPLPIDQVIWDYQIVGGETNGELQVVLAAIKADLLDEINSVIEETGLRTSTVDVAAMARYNAFRYSYNDLNDCSLLINIGAYTTNLLFIEPGKLFSRTIPIGGGSITAAIAKEFGEPFAAAESRKKRDSVVPLDSVAEQPKDVDVARVATLARNTMTRLHAELVRSISHYRGQQQGNLPQRIFLGGGGASIPFIREFFREKLQLPTDFFNPLRNIAVAETAPVEEVTRSAHLLGELVGLALRTANNCPMELNLRPANVVRRQELEKRRPLFIAAAACFVLGVVGHGAYYTRAAHLTQSGAQQIQETINAPMRAAEAKIDKLRKEATLLESVASPLIAAINDRFFWVEILGELNARLPKEDIWITELIPTSGGKPIGADEKQLGEIAPSPRSVPLAAARSPSRRATGGPAIDGIFVRGLYLFNPRQQEVVVDYFRNLAASPFFNVDPNNQAEVIKSTIPTNMEWAFPYELRLDLRKPVKLP